MPARKSKPTVEQVAAEKFGYESLRPGQKEAVQAVLDGHDVLVVQPTGSGKSAIYQLAGLLIEGSTVIVSPLIALQKDQVDSISNNGAAEAVLVNSTQRVAESKAAWERIEEGAVEYIFLAPEQLKKPEVLEKLKAANVSLFVVDEAHCVSEWGHDFRPDYLQLGAVIDTLDRPRILAMTATASPEVRSEIIERLRMQKAKVFVRGFDRPNIYLRVDHFESEDKKREALVHRVRWAEKPGIIYVSTRKNAEEIMAGLSEEGIDSVFYHGGLKAKDRETIHERFMSGDAEVIVATNAFGMGVDKANVRFVYHYDVSDSLDAYYQEVGRAGRDGEKAEAVLFFRSENIGAQGFKTGQGKLDVKVVEEIAEKIAAEEQPVSPKEIAAETDLSERKLDSVLHLLEDAGAIQALPTGEVIANEDADLSQAAQAAAEQQELRGRMKKQRLEQMRAYAEGSTCRRAVLLQYFGDEFSGPCDNCDVCEAVQPAVALHMEAGTRREVS